MIAYTDTDFEKHAMVNQFIIHILIERFDVALSRFPINRKEHFFGVNGLLCARDMIYLVHILEEKYDIVFTEADFDDLNFYTLDGLMQNIEHKRNSKFLATKM